MTIGISGNSGADCYTGWSASGARDAFFMEAEELNPKGQITVAMRTSPADGRDQGWATNRLLKFVKKSASSHLRLTWASNLRVRAHNKKGGAWCHWELRIDGKSCTQPSKIGVSMHSQHNDNDHIPVEVVGWCRNIGQGNDKLQIYITRGSGNADCYTGWNAHDYMEAWEPTPAEMATMSYMQRVGKRFERRSDHNACATWSKVYKCNKCGTKSCRKHLYWCKGRDFNCRFSCNESSGFIRPRK